MSEKPSYLGLLNAIAVGEAAAEGYLTAWAAATADEAVREVISTVALREGEHGKAFAKRIGELGYRVRPKTDSGAAERMAVASSTELSDREKFERLGLAGRARREGVGADADVFSGMFHDRSIDIQTGALLGRYIAEERDSGRLLAGCYAQLCAAEPARSPAATNGDRTPSGNGQVGTASTDDLAAALARIEGLLEQLVAQGAKPAKARARA